jgi:DNA integrity scanning protein DisA with diadenylate cyclase activity
MLTVPAINTELLKSTLTFEGAILLLLLIHLIIFFRRYRNLGVTLTVVLLLAGSIGVLFSNWNFSIEAPLIKKWTWIYIYIGFSLIPYGLWIAKKIATPANIKKFLAKKGPIDEVTVAVQALSEEKVGGLIVLALADTLAPYIEKGLAIDSSVKRELIISLFAPNTPTHDGAVIIEGDRITACSVVLPLSDHYRADSNFGTRHLAALGLSEKTDALVIVISEETGKVSIASDGRLHYSLSLSNLSKNIRKLMK